MMHAPSGTRSAHRVLFVAALALLAVLSPLAERPAAARGRLADAAPTALAYHLSVVFVGGPHAGKTMDGGLMGMVDSFGIVTATLGVAGGMTSTVSGSLDPGTGASLSVAGKAGTIDLAGKQLPHSTTYAGLLALPDGTATGMWLLTPETVARSFAFAATIASGRHNGDGVSGTLTINADRGGRFDGAVALDDGSSLYVSGRMAYNNLQLALYMPDGGVILGTAPLGHSIVDNAVLASYKGQFAGPGTGDHGVWTAIASS